MHLFRSPICWGEKKTRCSRKVTFSKAGSMGEAGQPLSGTTKPWNSFDLTLFWVLIWPKGKSICFSLVLQDPNRFQISFAPLITQGGKGSAGRRVDEVQAFVMLESWVHIYRRAQTVLLMVFCLLVSSLLRGRSISGKLHKRWTRAGDETQ
jgi:hypothetical protein